MPKRKRDGAEVDGGSLLSATQQRMQYKLDQNTRKLGHAFKIGKGFERQKLGRRLKLAVAEKNEQDTRRIESEIAELKTLDTTSAAKQHLIKILLKVKSIAESDALPSSYKSPLPTPSSAARLNVTARLSNSNPVKTALVDVLNDISRTLGVSIDNGAGAKKKRLRAKDYEMGGRQRHNEDIVGEPKNESAAPKLSNPAIAEQSGGTTISKDGGAHSISEDELEELDDMLAPASSEEDAYEGSASDDVEALERQLEDEGIARAQGHFKYDPAADMSLSEEINSPSQSPEPQKAPASQKSSFLPSLSLVGYISGSGSDLDDDDTEVGPTRKNRRGQRARQQIWEKKYGDKAKHLQQAKEGGRSVGWDAKRGATDDGGRRRKGESKRKGITPGGGQARRSTGAASATGANGIIAVKKSHKDDAGPLHPSWQAKKLAKEKLSMTAKFEGKKITFD